MKPGRPALDQTENTVRTGFALTETLWQLIQEAARRKGVPVSRWLRDAALFYLARSKK